MPYKKLINLFVYGMAALLELDLSRIENAISEIVEIFFFKDEEVIGLD
jgi:hypothetical protein